MLFVAESGIGAPEDARRVRAAGAQAILVGEALIGTPHDHLAAAIAACAVAPQRAETGHDADQDLRAHPSRRTSTRRRPPRLGLRVRAADSPRQVSVARAAELAPLCGDRLVVSVVATVEPE